MDWSARINLAIEYIEKNLNGEVNINEVAKRAFSSPFHFQRMFFAMIGITPTEYLRRRRLTLAATELSTGTTNRFKVRLRIAECFYTSIPKYARYQPAGSAHLRSEIVCISASFYLC